MPTSAVYQPTTVTYEQQPSDQRWRCPIYYFTRRINASYTCTYLLRLGLTIVGCFLSFLGLSLVIAGAVQYNTQDSSSGEYRIGIRMLISGGVVLCVGLLVTGLGTLAWRSRFEGGKESPANGAAALTALNPSTDPLVAAQYAPVRDAPPAPDDEMRNLMDNKDCLSSAEESDKMLDGRPSLA